MSLIEKVVSIFTVPIKRKNKKGEKPGIFHKIVILNDPFLSLINCFGKKEVLEIKEVEEIVENERFGHEELEMYLTNLNPERRPMKHSSPYLEALQNKRKEKES